MRNFIRRSGMTKGQALLTVLLGLVIGLGLRPMFHTKAHAQTPGPPPVFTSYIKATSPTPGSQTLWICCTNQCFDNGTGSVVFTNPEDGVTYTFSLGAGTMFCGYIYSGNPPIAGYKCFYGVLPNGELVICVRPPETGKFDGFCTALQFPPGNFIGFNPDNPSCGTPGAPGIGYIYEFYYDTNVSGQ